jgi:hypothetical protein
MDITQAAGLIQSFENGSLTKQIGKIERELVDKNPGQINKSLSDLSILPAILDAALTLKRTAGQINVIIHTLGIVLSLPYILEKDEVVQALSLGAGNTGKPFDLETDRRVAEYKFIHWRGGTESIRKNQLFKDFFLLSEFDTSKKKYLYVLGKDLPIKFLKGDRAINSVMSRNKNVDMLFHELYGDRFSRVHEYYQYRQNDVELVDLLEVLPPEIGRLFD